MTSLADVRPGDIVFARHVSPKSADLLILGGQIFLGEPGYPHHVMVVTQGADLKYSHRPFRAKIVQAMPSGAEEVEIGQEHWTKDYTYVRPAYPSQPSFPVGNIALIMQGQAVANAARKYIDTPYSFLDYAALTGLRLGIRNGPIRRYVTSSKHQICSQLADQAMSDAGWHIFDDGRLAQDVTPSALYAQMLKMPGQHLVPGSDWVPNIS